MTYTVLAASPRHGLLAAATASRSLAVGSTVIAVAPGIGAAATQAHTNPVLRHALLEELRAGAAPDAAIEAMGALDARLGIRQLAVLSAEGAGAAHTGEDCTDWAGHRVGEGFVVAGNYLAGPEVVSAMGAVTADELGSPQLLAGHVLAVLAAGQAAGGDRRGRQSAAILVADSTRVIIDLRVDDAADPLAELGRLLELTAAPLTARTE